MQAQALSSALGGTGPGNSTMTLCASRCTTMERYAHWLHVCVYLFFLQEKKVKTLDVPWQFITLQWYVVSIYLLPPLNPPPPPCCCCSSSSSSSSSSLLLLLIMFFRYPTRRSLRAWMDHARQRQEGQRQRQVGQEHVRCVGPGAVFLKKELAVQNSTPCVFKARRRLI